MSRLVIDSAGVIFGAQRGEHAYRNNLPLEQAAALQTTNLPD